MYALEIHTYDNDDEIEQIKKSFLHTGYGVASTYSVTKGIQLKTSYEHTYRLPETHELFGDGLLLFENANLIAEQSNNFNVGVLAKYKKGVHEFLIEAEYLYRVSTGFIRLIPVGRGAKHENLTSVKGSVVEGGVKYNYKKRFNLGFNGTYQNLTNNQKLTPTGSENYLYGDRLPNKPFLFGNVMGGVQFKKRLEKTK